ncbi:sporulation protein YunB [Bacillus sp. V-88]|nr:sporulation protein YunB [Bacillus sp. DSM 27956]PRX76991.1 sporulation protein YunB [Bacillus sp. V-88]SLK20973.1 sporulation protein YunB [Bacillus sp. V-88]
MSKFKTYKPRRGGPLPFRHVMIITFLFFMISTGFGLWIINKGLKPTLLAYAETQTSRIGTLVINKAINKKIADVLDISDITEEVKNQDGDIVSFKYNTQTINRVQAEITNLVQQNLQEAEAGNIENLEFLTEVEIDEGKSKTSKGITYSVPLGQATNNVLLGNLGPKIPIRFHSIGDVRSDVKTTVEQFGINNAVVKVFVELEVNVQIIIPFATKTETIKQDILVAMGTVHLDVPQFYNNGGGASSPSIEFPTN